VTASPHAGADLARVFAAFARAEGLELYGTTPLAPLQPEGERLERWVAAGLHGGLTYLVESIAVRTDPTRPEALRAGARGALVLGYPSARLVEEGAEVSPRRARYARGRNYHVVLRALLRRLATRLRAEFPELPLRRFCDRQPILEKALAVRAGLGFQGRNTLVIHPRGGSHFLLAGMLVAAELPASPPVPSGCGDCRRCLDACPTGALREPGVLDASRCLSRWNHSKQPPPPGLPAGPYDYGCDVCQDVCPFNASGL
jgi:epoxyqueuosine reductase